MLSSRETTEGNSTDEISPAGRGFAERTLRSSRASSSHDVAESVVNNAAPATESGALSVASAAAKSAQ